MELRHMRYFVALAEELHFAKAAARLHIVQPALSMQIKLLEEELDVALFKRSPRKVELTAAGAAFMKHARACLLEAERAMHTARDAAAGAVGRVRIGYSATAIYSGFMKQLLEKAADQHPGIHIEVEEVHPRSQFKALENNELDIALSTIISQPPVGARFKTMELLRFPLQLALPENHPLARQATLSVDQLGELAFIGYAGPEDKGGMILTERALGFKPVRSVRASSPQMALALAEAGLGGVIVPCVMTAHFNGRLAYRTIEGINLEMDITLVYRTAETDPAVQMLCALIERESSHMDTPH